MKQKSKKGWKRVLKIILIVMLVYCVISVGIARFMMNRSSDKKEAPGNAEKYDVSNVKPLDENILTGKKILFLGSSVTKGQASLGTSFVEYIEKRDGVIGIKDAQSATTLADKWSAMAFMGYGNGDSYVKRLKKQDTSIKLDCVVCQLSTNDASKNIDLGDISDSEKLEDFDTQTVTGAMEYIIAYTQQTWNCPIIFYTNSYYENDNYEAMVDRLMELKDKWDIGVIDLYHDKELNDIDQKTRELYMWDDIHPTKAGYLEWWTPQIEAAMEQYLEKNRE